MEKATHGSTGMLHALEVAAKALGEVGAHRVELVTVAREWLCIQPEALSDGANIAGELRLSLPRDHRMIAPAYTVWSGDREGLEVQVRAELRQTAGTLL